MEYITVQKAAEKWGVSQRLVQKYCAQGRIEGARKFGVSWEIPADAQKPQDPRKGDGQPASQSSKQPCTAYSGLMPLMNTAFEPGHCMDFIEQIENPSQKKIALAEYYYFSGQAEKAAQEAELHLADPNLYIQLSACLVYIYANLSTGNIYRARYGLAQVKNLLAATGSDTTPELQAAESFIAVTSLVLLHLPVPEDLLTIKDALRLLPPGLRAFALYVQAHYTYLQGDYRKSLGIVEATLSMQEKVYPIPTIYLHLVAVMDCISLKDSQQAEAHLLAAWDLARPDDLIEGFGEHHGLLGGTLEAVIQKDWPEDFKRIIAITYRFSSGWRQIHNPDTGEDVADNLTTTEFSAAMLAARGWTNQEIGKHMNISPNTVKRYISTVLQKLNIQRRQDLKKYMLR